MTGRHKSDDFIHQPRRDRTYEEHVQDPYLERGKPSEPAFCPDCSSVFHKGRWQWIDVPDGASQHRCPACSRIHDKVPAATLTLSGAFFTKHKGEILSLIHNAEVKEKAEHPLERIMGIEENDAKDRTVISYTGIHLAKGSGEALHKAYQGEFNLEFTERDGVLHASWQR